MANDPDEQVRLALAAAWHLPQKNCSDEFWHGEGHTHLQAIQNTSKFQGEPGPCGSTEEQGGMAVTVKGRLTDSNDSYMLLYRLNLTFAHQSRVIWTICPKMLELQTLRR